MADAPRRGPGRGLRRAPGRGRGVGVRVVAVALAVPAALAGVAGCGGSPAGGAKPPGTGAVRVLAAASFTNAFDELARRYEAGHPGTTVRVSYAASSVIAAQVREGAPADVVVTADEASMRLALGKDAGKARLLARNRMVIVVPGGNPARVGTLADLARHGLRLALAAPTVPAGRYVAAVFAKAKMAVPPASQETDVRAVLTKVALGEADAGIVYASDAKAPAARGVDVVDIPARDNVAAASYIANLTPAGAPFARMALSPEGRAVLRRWGFSA